MSSVTLDNNIKDTIISPNALIIIDKKTNDLYIRDDFDNNNIDDRFIGTFLIKIEENITIIISISIEEPNTRSTRANPAPPASGPIQIQLQNTYTKYILTPKIICKNDCGLTAERFTLNNPKWRDGKDSVLVVKSTRQPVNNSKEENTTIAKQLYGNNTINDNADPLLKESFYTVQTFNVENRNDYPPGWKQTPGGVPVEENFKYGRYANGNVKITGNTYNVVEWTQYHVAYVFGKFTTGPIKIYLTCESDSSDLTRLAPKFALYSSTVDFIYNIYGMVLGDRTTMAIPQKLTTFHGTFADYFGNACKTIVVHGIQPSQTPSTSSTLVPPATKKQKRGGGYCKSKRIIKKMRKNRMKTSKRR